MCGSIIKDNDKKNNNIYHMLQVRRIYFNSNF